MFRSIVVNNKNGSVVAGIENIPEETLPVGDLLVRVEYSTINYKDGMILNGLGRLVRNYPHIPGIDAVGTVQRSTSEEFSVGDKVILGGHRFGEIVWGGYSEFVSLSDKMAVKLPPSMTPWQSMALGTAGFSAMLAINSLESHGLVPADREVLVTGAVGGVGSVAVALLSKLGYRVAASTGRGLEREYLMRLGAASIIDRTEFEETSTKPLESERWDGCIDNVGGQGFSKILRQMSSGTSIASVGLAGGAEFQGNIMPFLLRGVNILGIDSVSVGRDERVRSWQRLAELFPMQLLEEMTHEIAMADVIKYGRDILKGNIKGRVVVSM